MLSLKFFSRLRLAPALAAVAALLMLLLTFATLQVVEHAMTRQVKLDIGRDLAELAYQTTDKLDRGMHERYREVRLMAERIEITDGRMSRAIKRAALESMQDTHPYYAWIGLTDNDGNVVTATKGMLEGKNVSQRPWFSAAYRDVHLHDVHEAVLLAKLLPNPGSEPKRFFDIAFPYRDGNGRIAGILGTHLSWQWAQDVELSVLRPLAERKSVDTLILSKEGVVLLGPRDYRDRTLALESIRQARSGANGAVIETWPDGRKYLVGFSQGQGHQSYPGLGWTVLVRQPLEEAFAPVDALSSRITWSGLVAAAVVSLLVWLASKSIIKPLETITGYADMLRAGHAAALPQVRTRLVEVRILQGALNGLLSDLLANQEGLRELNATLETRVAQRTAELHESVEETQKGERRVRAIIDTALDAFVGVDSQGRITDWNPRAEEIFGWSRQEAMGRTVAETIIPHRLRAAHEAGMRRFSAAGSSGVVGKRIQLAALRRDGEEFPIEMTIGLINAGDSHFFGTFIQDISARKKAEDELARERELLGAILESIDVGVVVCSSAGDITMFNRAAKEIHGLDKVAAAPQHWWRHYRLLGSDGETPLRLTETPLHRALDGELVENMELTVQPAQGTRRTLLASGRGLYASNGASIGAVIALKDITSLKEAARCLEQSERRLRTITDNVPVLIGYVDSTEQYRFANATYETWFDLAPGQIVGKTVQEVMGDGLYARYRQHFVTPATKTADFEMVLQTRLGQRTIRVTRIPDIQDGEYKGVYVLGADISAAKLHEQELAAQARVDTLTGLPNRRAYQERLPEALRRAQRNGTAVALMFLDVDHFKQVNDTLGHAAGDLVLTEFGRRIRSAVRATDIVCRLAGDEFTVVLEGLKSPDQAALVAAKIVAAFEHPMSLKDTERTISTSIGVAYAAAFPIAPDDLEAGADSALYQAKRQGRACHAMTVMKA